MNAREVSEALGQIDEQFVTEALTYTPRKTSLWRPIATVAACLCLLVGLLVPPVSPPSSGGQMELYFCDGIPLYGPVITHNGDSVTADSVCVTVDVVDFPSQTAFRSYSSTATMELTLRNTSEETVTVDLTLPCGPITTYFPYSHFMTGQEQFNCDLSKYAVAVNGTPIQTSARLSGSDELPLSNDSWENGVFSNDTPLTKLTYQVTELKSNDSFSCAGFYFRRTSLTPYLFYEGYARPDDNGRLCFGVTEGSTIELYFVGSVPDVLPQWGFYSSMEQASPVEGTMALLSTESMTFLEYASQSWHEEYGVSVSDWACSVAAELLYRDFSSMDGFIPVGIIDVRVTTYRWLDYSLTLKPGETIVNTITMPVYPSLSSVGNYQVCEYTLDLLSLQALNPTGEQVLTVNTNFAMTESSVGFINLFDSYTTDLRTVNGSETSFRLASSTESQTQFSSPQIHWLTVLGGVMLAVLGLYWLLRRRTQ